MAQYYTTIIAILATYGLSTLLAEFEGYKDVFVWLRTRIEPLRCAVCASCWIAMPIVLFAGLGLLEYFAIIGSVIILDRLLNL